MSLLVSSNIILSILIAIHLCCEFFHYISSFFNDRKDEKMLKHLDEHMDKLEKKNNDEGKHDN